MRFGGHRERDLHRDPWPVEHGEVRKSIEAFSIAQVNHLPLLHVSIARQFLPPHRDFCAFTDGTVANYFEYVGDQPGEVLIRHPGWPVSAVSRAAMPDLAVS